MKGLNSKQTVDQPSAGNVLNCLWMDAGVVGYKLCDRSYECEHCPFDEALHSHPQKRSFIANRGFDNPQTSISVEGCKVGEGLFYHPSHTWARVEADGIVRIGVDDFGQRILGTVYSVSLPARNRELRRGEVACAVTHQSGVTALPSPLAGKVLSVNSGLLARPALLNRDPFGDGWTMTVEPSDLKNCLRELLYGEKIAPWLAGEIEKLHTLITGIMNNDHASVATLPDGGMLTREFMHGLNVAETRRVINSFFPLTSIDAADHKTAILFPKGR